MTAAPDSAVKRGGSVLRARNLVKRYRKRTVVNDVSLTVSAGEIVGLLGPNGAGKTTSFYMVVGLVPADSGVIELDNQDITRLPMHARARQGIGYLPQEASVFRKLSVADNILAILELRDDLDKKGRLAELERLLAELHIGHVREGLGMSLSGGERRRCEIARALAANPRFILLDEPFAGVDPIAVIDIQGIVRHLAERGIGVLITDHNVRETLGICNRAYILAEGRVIAEGAPTQLLENETVRRVYLGEQFRL
ncbi:MAG: LPS export ABC transporter ATP-binding protein [Nevskia sp.]|nr:LPS export ABC transporter ATP-binding protein [Nevskia sp.]MCK9384369.1 LPS export ABC transporter ATP-binding protein [Nevskia sp.]